MTIDESKQAVKIKSLPDNSSTKTEKAIAKRFEEVMKGAMKTTIETMPAKGPRR